MKRPQATIADSGTGAGSMRHWLDQRWSKMHEDTRVLFEFSMAHSLRLSLPRVLTVDTDEARQRGSDEHNVPSVRFRGRGLGSLCSQICRTPLGIRAELLAGPPGDSHWPRELAIQPHLGLRREHPSHKPRGPARRKTPPRAP